MIICGDSLDVLRTLDADSVDAVVTDPPYGWRFMGKAWDGADIVEKAKRGPTSAQKAGNFQGPNRGISKPSSSAGEYNLSPSANKSFQDWTELWAREVFRVLKPGGHMLVFCGPRTYHRMASGVEDAGFEIRDQLQWIFGSGFPKSHNIGEGRGTALKPANEPIVLARKPLSESTVAKNVLKWGVGCLNIDGSRIGTNELKSQKNGVSSRAYQSLETTTALGDYTPNTQGRWPANVIFDEAAAEMLDQQVGFLHGAGNKQTRKAGVGEKSNSVTKAFGAENGPPTIIHDRGGQASRFFYCAKASKAERNRGLEGMPEKVGTQRMNASLERHEVGREPTQRAEQSKNQNHHPTVKPIKLMEYLVRLITPPGGTVLDPFMGSGSTGVACNNLGFKFIGIEMNADYVEIARRRVGDEHYRVHE